MSKARLRKKLAKQYLVFPGRVISGKGSVAEYEYDRLYSKRLNSDLYGYLIGQSSANAPVKYSRCKGCVGNPHHPPTFFFGRH